MSKYAKIFVKPVPLSSTIDVEDDELLASVIDDICLIENGKMQAFTPIVVNVIRHWINQVQAA